MSTLRICLHLNAQLVGNLIFLQKKCRKVKKKSIKILKIGFTEYLKKFQKRRPQNISVVRVTRSKKCFADNINDVYFAHSRRDIHFWWQYDLRGRAVQTMQMHV